MGNKLLRTIFALGALLINLSLVIGLILPVAIGGGVDNFTYIMLVKYYIAAFTDFEGMSYVNFTYIGALSILIAITALLIGIGSSLLFLFKGNRGAISYMASYGPCAVIGSLAIFFSVHYFAGINYYKFGIATIIYIVLAVISLLLAPIMRFLFDEKATFKTTLFELVRSLIGVGFVFVSMFCFRSFIGGGFDTSIYIFNGNLFRGYISSAKSGGTIEYVKIACSAAAAYISVFIPVFLPQLIPMASMPTKRDMFKQRDHNSNKAAFRRLIPITISLVIILVLTFMAAKDLLTVKFSFNGWICIISIVGALILTLLMSLFGKEVPAEQQS